METILKLLEQNQFASGGLLLMLLGALAAYASRVPAVVLRFARRRFVFSMEVPFTDPAFLWLKYWLNRQSFLARRRSYLLESRHTGEDTEGRPVLLFVPAEGLYVVRHAARFLLVRLEREELKSAVVQGYGGRMVAWRETITLACLGRQASARAYVETILREAYDLMQAESEGRIRIHRPELDSSDWIFVSLASPRSPDSLVLRAGLFERLTADVREFRSGADWYRDMGIPWRRGYLLYGEPGNGKSSLVLTIAGQEQLDVYILDLSNPRLTDAALNDLVTAVPENSILVIEDVDAAFAARTDRGAVGSSGAIGISFSGLLNALDGVAAGQGRLLFMTTNHRERLDPALIRPGRADLHLAIENPDREQIERLFLRFFPGEEDRAADFARTCLASEPSMAELQEHLLEHRRSAHDACQSWGTTNAQDAAPAPGLPPGPVGGRRPHFPRRERPGRTTPGRPPKGA